MLRTPVNTHSLKINNSLALHLKHLFYIHCPKNPIERMSRLPVVVIVLLVVSIFSSFTKIPPSKLSQFLAFPVSGMSSKIGSFWGDVRDGGKRKHEGIDIFAKLGTPVVAIADGKIVSKGNGGLGGKTLWLRASNYGWTAYYAHLNEQKVKLGQFVKKGQVIGTVGKTGNARYTPPHLHFGIYGPGGAVNPLPYVKNSPKIKTPLLSPTYEQQFAKKTLPAKQAVSGGYEFPEKYILKKVKVAADPSSKYYVTTRSNFVRVSKGQLQILGKWKKNTNIQYPYQLALTDNKKLLVSKTGRLMTASGIEVGSISSP
jgi:hypothetical protein